MSQLREMLAQDFMRHVLAGTVIVAALCSYLGVFIVLRRAVFVGAALAQVSSLGVALAMSAGALLHLGEDHTPHLPAGPFAWALTLTTAVVLAAQRRERRLPRESIVAIVYVAAAALAILAIALSVHAEAEVLNLLFGNVLTIGRGTVVELAAVTCVLGLIHAAACRRFLFVSFDPDMATALGVRARWWNLALFLTIGAAVAAAIHAAGMLVVFNFLVVPAATALLIGKTLRQVFALAVLTGVVAAVAGVCLSYVADLPTGPAIIAINVALLAAAALWRRVG
jgi:zinc transport system permease protein